MWKHLRAYLYTLKKLVHFFVRHLLAQLGQHIPQLAGTDVPIAFFVEHLEASDKLV